MIVLEGGFRVAMDMSSRRPQKLISGSIWDSSPGLMLIALVFGIQDNGPSGWEVGVRAGPFCPLGRLTITCAFEVERTRDDRVVAERNLHVHLPKCWDGR